MFHITFTNTTFSCVLDMIAISRNKTFQKKSPYVIHSRFYIAQMLSFFFEKAVVLSWRVEGRGAGVSCQSRFGTYNDNK